MIVLKNISKTYLSTQKTVLEDVNLHIHKGDFVIIKGESGSGKSTLLKIIGCLDSQFKGSMIFDKKIIDEETDEQILSNIRKLRIGYIFQDFKLLNEYTINQNLDVILSLLDYSKNSQLLMKKALEKVNLTDSILDDFPYQLSGGQKQRVAIARAILKNTDILIGDEITGALDVKNSDIVMNILKELNLQGITIVLATHDEKYLKFGNRLFLVEGKDVHEVNTLY